MFGRQKKARWRPTRDDRLCPLIGGRCIQDRCAFWIELTREYPLPDKDEMHKVQEGRCSYQALTELMIENKVSIVEAIKGKANVNAT